MIDQTRKNNLGFNLYQILAKYTMAGSFLRGMADILRRINGGNTEEAVRLSAQKQYDEGLQYSEDRNQRFEKQRRMNA